MPLTQIQEFDLNMEHRAVDRAEFDKMTKEKEIMVVFGWKENGFHGKSFFMGNVFPRKVDFHVTFSVVCYMINHFSWKKGKR